MPLLSLKPDHKSVRRYYESLADFDALGVVHETAVRSAFQSLLDDTAGQFKWKLVPEYPIRRPGQRAASVDAALVDVFNLPHGYWEAKDLADNLPREIKKKFAVGYPHNNILFQTPRRAVLYQGDRNHAALDEDITRPEALVDVLKAFLEYQPPAIADWEQASVEFKDKVPVIAGALVTAIRKEHKANAAFRTAFADFARLAKASLNPNLADAAVEEMLVQHILTERIFRKIFDAGDFMKRNVIAVEIEKVANALTSRYFNRDRFLDELNHFYGAIENAAATIKDFSAKQTFLNTVYERFFQGFCVKSADTHGIVYTPQPIVDFMVSSVDALLRTEFGRKEGLATPGVHVLDPFVGTGNFIVNLMDKLPPTALPHKYATELHCNEVLLLPYYIASMNIEHAYFEATNTYLPFEGICLVDTFQTAEGDQKDFEFFNEANSERVERQKKSPITVIIGNPPYNAWQQDENDNNGNREYLTLDKQVHDTYGKDSRATLQNSLLDPYVKAFRFASNRIVDGGIVAFVTNSGFVDGIATDGMRKNLVRDFDAIYVLDLGGNVRKNPKLSGTTHNVFGIQVGVAITFLVRRKSVAWNVAREATVYYASVALDWKRGEKYQFLNHRESLTAVEWQTLVPDRKYNWLTDGLEAGFGDLLPLGNKETKASGGGIFRTFSNGVKSNNDPYVYNFDRETLIKRAQRMVED